MDLASESVEKGKTDTKKKLKTLKTNIAPL